MNTEKQPGQHSNPQDPNQREKDQKSDQQRQNYNQSDPQRDRKPGQGREGNVPDKERKSA